MANPVLHTVSLCSGVGMLDEGVALACRFHGFDVRTVAYAEREASAAATLLARMEDQSLEPAPVWIDSLECLPREPLRGRVDAVIAGFPCPDFSVAGKQEGTEGERYLLPAILEIARDVGARWLFLENVRGIFSAGNGAAFGEIQQTLAAFGWSAEWATLRASEVGASHQRERWFCLAYRDVGRCGQCNEGERGTEEFGTGRAQLGDAKQVRRDGDARRQSGKESTHRRKQLADASGERREGGERRGTHEGQGAASRGAVSQLGSPLVFAPGPDDPRWGDIIGGFPHLAPAVEPGFRVVVNGDAVVVDEARNDQLRAAGNGVVALQAGCAYAELLGRFGVHKVCKINI